MTNTDETRRKNQVFCKICQKSMNKSEYIQHLKENGGTCIGNRKPKGIYEFVDKIRSMGEHVDGELQLAGLEKKNGLNGNPRRNHFRR